jgi:membrane associated rhomboid family serine protease
MKRFLFRLFGLLTPGVRVLLLVLTAFYLAAVVGSVLRVYDLYRWLALDPSAVWKGCVWQLFTYPLLPEGFIYFIFNAIAIVWLGRQLEREWSRWELWSYCLLAATGAAAAKLLLSSWNGYPLTGTAGIVFGMLVAWLRLFGHERVMFLSLWETTVLQTGLLMIAVGLLLMLFNARWVDTLVMFCGGLAGWLYLSLRWKLNREEPGQVTESERIRRLEL